MWAVIGATSLVAVGAGLAYVPPEDLALTTVVNHPIVGALLTGLLGLSLACAWLTSMVRAPISALTHRGILLGYFALWMLGAFSLLMLKYYQERGYPIAQHEVIPTLTMIRHAIIWEAAGGGALAYGLWLGSLTIRRARFLNRGVSQPVIEEFPPTRAGPHLARLGIGLFSIGAISSLIVVFATHSLAILDTNIDTVRYSQGAGIGFATLGQYELVTSGVIGLFLLIYYQRHRRLGLGLGLASVLILVGTRAERTPILVIVFATLMLARLVGKRPRVVVAFAVAATLLAGVLYLGVYRLQSQAGSVSSKEAQVRALLDISPEVRQQTFAFTLFPSQTPYLGSHGLLPVGLAVLPGKILGLLGVDKQSFGEDSSHLYTATMKKLALYSTMKPIRVGLAGELWMDAGPLGLIVGLALFGVAAAWLTMWRPTTPSRLVARALIITFLILSLVTPLAALSPIALITLFPLLLRDDKDVSHSAGENPPYHRQKRDRLSSNTSGLVRRYPSLPPHSPT